MPSKKELTPEEQEAAYLAGPGTFEIQGGRGAFINGRRFKRGDIVTLGEGERAGRHWIRLDEKGRRKKMKERADSSRPAPGHQAMSDMQNPQTRRPPGA
jgi:hypothetical protein